MTSETISKLTCLRCEYRWFPRKEGMPVRCPSCKSPYWDRARAGQPKPTKRSTDGLDEGMRYYAEHEAEIKEKYLGQYVAVTADGVIDFGPNFSDLVDRVFEHGAYSLLVRQVTEKERVVTLRPRFRVIRP